MGRILRKDKLFTALCAENNRIILRRSRHEDAGSVARPGIELMLMSNHPMRWPFVRVFDKDKQDENRTGSTRRALIG